VFEPPVVEPGVAAGLADFVLELGVGDAGAFATVTVGALAVAVSGEPLPLATETAAENLIVSPAGAVLGTLTCASICDAAGCFAGRVRSQLVLVGLLVQLSTVNTGWLNAGVFAPGVRVVAIAPFSDEVDHAEIRNRMVPPGCTLFADAETVTVGFVGVGVVVGVGVGVGLVVEGDGEGDAGGEAAGLFVAVAAGVAAGVAAEVAAGVAAWELENTAGAVDAAWVLENTAGAVDAACVPDAPVSDGVAEADGVAAAMAVPVMPLEMTKRPVARPSVTGLACGDRMKTPCLCVL
jgi:hypothetical protein